MKKYLGIVLLVFGFSGCFNSWTDAQKNLLETQAQMLASIVSKNNQVSFKECFKEYIMDNYSAKEWMNGGETPASLAIIECQKQKN